MRTRAAEHGGEALRGLIVLVACLVGATVLAGCGQGVDSGGLTASDRGSAQAAMDALQSSNISRQLVTLTNTAARAPAACRVHLQSRNSATFEVYVFWIPYIGPNSYTWLNMSIARNVGEDKFHLGSAEVLPTASRGRTGGSRYEPLSMGGARQARQNHAVLVAHAGDAFAKPGANCQVLMNGYLRLLPNP